MHFLSFFSIYIILHFAMKSVRTIFTLLQIFQEELYLVNPLRMVRNQSVLQNADWVKMKWCLCRIMRRDLRRKVKSVKQQIRISGEGIEDYSKIILLISQRKDIL